MPAHRLPWIKFWPELLDHEKFADLTDSERWTWVVVWAKASQQPTRWRYASAQHAAHVTGRPLKHIRKLAEVGLLDDCGDGLLIHDASDWQEDSKLTRSMREHPSNSGGTVAEEWSKGGGRVAEEWLKSGRRVGLEREGERDIDKDAVAAAAAPGTSSTRNGYVAAETAAAAAAGWKPMSALAEGLRRQRRRQIEDLPDEVLHRMSRPPIPIDLTASGGAA